MIIFSICVTSRSEDFWFGGEERLAVQYCTHNPQNTTMYQLHSCTSTQLSFLAAASVVAASYVWTCSAQLSSAVIPVPVGKSAGIETC